MQTKTNIINQLNEYEAETRRLLSASRNTIDQRENIRLHTEAHSRNIWVALISDLDGVDWVRVDDDPQMQTIYFIDGARIYCNESTGKWGEVDAK